jgi:fumarate hydratase subunit beta
MINNINTPIPDETVTQLSIGDMILISGFIYTGRDAVLPKIVSLIQSGKISEYGIQLQGSVIFHTAVSPAGVGPTSSNKYEIESTMPALSVAGVKLHLGKGALSKETVQALKQYNSVYAVIPPVTALLKSKTSQQKVTAFPEEGMEAFHVLEVKEYPAIVAVAHGKSIYDENIEWKSDISLYA